MAIITYSGHETAPVDHTTLFKVDVEDTVWKRGI